MNIAEQEIKGGAPSGTLILAESQTRGRGRVSRNWSSNPSGNLYFTFIMRFTNQSYLKRSNFAAAIACCEALSEVIPNVGIKWPNDILVPGKEQPKKISGMLVDGSIQMDPLNLNNEFTASIGVGINVLEDMTQNQDESIRDSATSCFNVLGEKSQVSRELILASFCNSFERVIMLDDEEMMQEYLKWEMVLGKEIVVMPKKREDTSSYYHATAIEFDENAQLIVRLENGQTQTLLTDEVMLRFC